MKVFRVVSIFTASVLLAALAFAATEKEPTAPLTQQTILQRYGFIDEDCDGFNDLARDADNDGIPNCQDPDWVRPRDGSGYQSKYGYKHKNANKQSGGPNAYSYNYLWNNNWANSNGPNLCNPTAPNNSQGRNRRSKGKH
jgi:hypothetical protein